MKVGKLVAWPVLCAGLIAPALMNCSAAEDAQALAEGCDKEFNALMSGDASAVANLDIDAKFKAMMTASADLAVLAEGMIEDTSAACTAMANDLELEDTWTAKGDPSSPEYTQEVCGAVATAIGEIKAQASASGGCTFGLEVSPSEIKCEASISAQASCEGQCQVDADCQPGSVNARCEGEISGECSGECSGDVTCKGSAEVAANCEGTCAAECTGTCEGECTGTIEGGCEGTCSGTCDGECSAEDAQGRCEGTCSGTCEGTCTQPAANATCKGQCAAKCTGTCTGDCEFAADASVECEGKVSCSGGCSVEYTEPTCSGEITPPSCEVDADCSASCEASAEANATCTEPSVVLTYSCSGEADFEMIDKLVATLRTNLPKLLINFQARGEAAVNLAGDFVGSLEGVVSASGSLSGKALVCIKAAIEAQANVQANVSVSVEASASVSGEASGSGGT